MQIVIDIPDNFNLENEINVISNPVIRKALKSGTPLPEYYGRLVDISKIEFLDRAPISEYDRGWHYAIYDCIQRLNCAPKVLVITKEGDKE